MAPCQYDPRGYLTRSAVLAGSQDKSIRLYEKPEPEAETQDDDDDDDSDSDDDDDDGTEEERSHLLKREVPDSKYLCINLKLRPRSPGEEPESKEPESKEQKTEEPAVTG